ncbi:MAG: MBL fold metallo-hydrolase [Lachnospiraceae bacterium]|nr:MBL fold metallo-hydrolase [Lachnospiraceae bacterium]
MKIVNLMEDTKGVDGCINEHGLCFYAETNKHKLLVDTGASDAILENAKTLGIDLAQVDTVVISHGHYDHTGGLLAFAKENPNAKIYMRANAGRAYYSIKEQGEKYIGIHQDILKLPQLVLVEGDLQIDEELSLFTNVTGRRFWAKGNLLLKRKDGEHLVQDEFEHEQCLVVTEGERNVLFSGCAHNGILNILEKYRELYQSYPDMVVSGFHMIQQEYTPEDIENIRQTARELAKLDCIFYSGHCTGQLALDVMIEIMQEQLHQIHSGTRIL